MTRLPGRLRRRRDQELQDVQRGPRVAVGEPRDVRQHLVGGLRMLPPEPALLVLQRAAQDGDDRRLVERLQHEDLGA